MQDKLVLKRVAVKFRAGRKGRIQKAMEQREEPFLTCNDPKHRYHGSIHPKEHVPRELFMKEGSLVVLKWCADCRTYDKKLKAKKVQKKRQALEGVTGDYKCLRCKTMRNADFCEGCAAINIRSSKLQRESYAKVLLERVQEMGSCCYDCKKVFLKSPNGIGFVIADSFEGVDLFDIELRNLEFDHLNEAEQIQEFGEFRGSKRRGVSREWSYHSQKFESRKCLLRCIFCHKLKTQQRINERQGVRSSMRPSVVKKVEFVRCKKIEIGKCECCAFPVNPENLGYYEFDHIDPTQKRDLVSNIARRDTPKFSIEYLKEEMARCRLLCSFCHRVRNQEQGVQRMAEKREAKRSKK